jgi:hypothetical protein
MILRFTSKNTNDVVDLHLELLDNKAVHSWAEYAVSKNATLTTHYYNLTETWSPHSIDECIEKCAQAIEELSKLNLHCPFPVPKKDQINHTWCNQAHRWFTHTHESARVTDKDRMGCKESEWLHQLNYYIHKLEDTLPLPVPITKWENEIVAYDANKEPGPGWWNTLNIPIDEETRKNLHSAEHHHVILNNEILGKSTLISYINQDNPLDWDTSGHSVSFGGIYICLTDNRQRIYQSKDFQQWLDRNGATSEDLYYDFPIGNIININDAQDLYKRMRKEEFTLTYHKE